MTAILFDLDGTIADSIPSIIETAVSACRDLGVSIKEYDIKPLIGIPLLAQGAILMGEERAHEFCEHYQHKYLAQNEECMHPFEGMREIVEDCKRQGAKLGIITSKGREGTEFLLRCMRLTEQMDVVIHANSGCGEKPSAAPVLAALAAINESPAHAIFIGDSIFDIQCGKNAGIYTCAVLWGAATSAELLAEAPEHVAATPAILHDILNNFIAEHSDKIPVLDFHSFAEHREQQKKPEVF